MIFCNSGMILKPKFVYKVTLRVSWRNILYMVNLSNSVLSLLWMAGSKRWFLGTCNGVSRCSWTNLLPTFLPESLVLWLFCFIHSSSHQQIIPIWNSSLFAFVAQQLVAVTTLPILLYCFLSIMIETCIWSSILLSKLPIIKVHFSE